MKKFFSIGETAKINRIPVKTLRYYDEKGVLHPAFINPETGYRYYSPEQFYLIDIIKYGKRLRLSLDEIKGLMGTKSIAELERQLESQKQQAQKEIAGLADMIAGIDATLTDLSYVSAYDPSSAPYYRIKPEKYVLYTLDEKASLTEADVRLKRMMADKKYQPYLTYRYGFFLTLSGLREGRIKICGECISLTQRPDFESSHVMKLERSRCACFQYPLFGEGAGLERIREYALSAGDPADYVIADEIFYSPEWKDCLYELCFDLAGNAAVDNLENRRKIDE